MIIKLNNFDHRKQRRILSKSTTIDFKPHYQKNYILNTMFPSDKSLCK